jgi:hypothetical protein
VRRIRITGKTAEVLKEDLESMEADLNEYLWMEYAQGPSVVLAEVTKTPDGRGVRMGGYDLVRIILAPTREPNVYDLAEIRLSKNTMDAVTVADRGHRSVGPWKLETPTRRTLDFVTIIDRGEYPTLRDHEKVAVNAAWITLKRGRRIESVGLGDEMLTLFEPAALAPDVSGREELAKMDAILREFDIGRASDDPYEVTKLRELLAEH